MYPEGCSYLPVFLTSGYTARKPKDPVLENTKTYSGSSPHR